MTTPLPHPLAAAEKTSAAASKAAASAPEAASWLALPAKPERRLTLAQRLAAEPEWTGTDNEGDDEDDSEK